MRTPDDDAADWPELGRTLGLLLDSRRADPYGGRADDVRLRYLLARAADGDTGAFMDFYDATCHLVWRLELRRWRTRSRAEDAAWRRFATAWADARGYPDTGLSPLAWLLSLSAPAHEGAA